MRRMFALLLLGFLCVNHSALTPTPQEEYERGIFSIYFMDEKVGYEEFTWHRDASGILLTVEGRITKPVLMSIDELAIMCSDIDEEFIQIRASKKLDQYYIPTRYPNGLPGGVPSRYYEVVLQIRRQAVQRMNIPLTKAGLHLTFEPCNTVAEVLVGRRGRSRTGANGSCPCCWP